MKIRLVSSKGQSTLVAYQDPDLEVEKKVYVDSELVGEDWGSEEEVPDEVIEYAIPYGIEWEAYVENILISKEAIARALYRNGIYTAEDYQRNPNAVLGAVREMSQQVLEQLNEVIRNFNHKGVES